MDIEAIKTLVDQYDKGFVTLGEFQVLLYQVAMKDDLEKVKEGRIIGWASTCNCRYPHNIKESYYVVDLHVHPHGYSMVPKGSLWQRILRAFRPNNRWLE